MVESKVKTNDEKTIIDLTKKIRASEKSIDDLAKQYLLIKKDTARLLVSLLEPLSKALIQRDIRELKQDKQEAKNEKT